MKKDSMRENVDQARLALAGGSLAAFAGRRPIVGTLFSVGSFLLRNENITENVSNLVLAFKSENVELHNVCLITKKKLLCFIPF